MIVMSNWLLSNPVLEYLLLLKYTKSVGQAIAEILAGLYCIGSGDGVDLICITDS